MDYEHILISPPMRNERRLDHECILSSARRPKALGKNSRGGAPVFLPGLSSFAAPGRKAFGNVAG